jgi:hypothetical protein
MHCSYLTAYLSNVTKYSHNNTPAAARPAPGPQAALQTAVHHVHTVTQLLYLIFKCLQLQQLTCRSTSSTSLPGSPSALNVSWLLVEAMRLWLFTQAALYITTDLLDSPRLCWRTALQQQQEDYN